MAEKEYFRPSLLRTRKSTGYQGVMPMRGKTCQNPSDETKAKSEECYKLHFIH